MTTAVMTEASSEHGNSAARAISSGWIMRPIGTRLGNALSKSAGEITSGLRPTKDPRPPHRLAGRVDCAIDVTLAPERGQGPCRAGRRIDRWHLFAINRGDPLATDEELVLGVFELALRHPGSFEKVDDGRALRECADSGSG